jgi:hypothetical protein
MTMRSVTLWVFGCAALLLATTPAAAGPLPTAAASAASGQVGLSPLPVDYRPYYHCHGPKRCHGKGNYYTYTPSDAPIVQACRYGRGCGYNNGWNSPSARDQYTGRRWHRHHRHRHRHR